MSVREVRSRNSELKKGGRGDKRSERKRQKVRQGVQRRAALRRPDTWRSTDSTARGASPLFSVTSITSALSDPHPPKTQERDRQVHISNEKQCKCSRADTSVSGLPQKGQSEPCAYPQTHNCARVTQPLTYELRQCESQMTCGHGRTPSAMSGQHDRAIRHGAHDRLTFDLLAGTIT